MDTKGMTTIQQLAYMNACVKAAVGTARFYGDEYQAALDELSRLRKEMR